jgi:ABC-type sugar transport system permease subunit
MLLKYKYVTAPNMLSLRKKTPLTSRVNFTPYMLLMPAFLIIFFLLIFPIMWNVYVAFHDVRLTNLQKAWPATGIQNFIELFQDEYFLESLQVSVRFVGGCVLFQLCFGLLLAAVLNKNLRGKEVFRTLLVLPWLFSAVIVGFSWRWIYNDTFGLLNFGLRLIGMEPQGWLSSPDMAIWSIVLANVWFGTPFSMLFMGSALTTIDKNLYEAATVDGATKVQSFFRITLPLLKPFITTNLILATIWTVNLFDLQLIMTGGGPLYSTTTVSLYMYRRAFQFGHLSDGAAVGLVLLCINVLVALVYIRIMRER